MNIVGNGMPDNFAKQRDQMVAFQLERRGIVSDSVLKAMRRVPREAFVPEAFRPCAYEDRPLDIGLGQTISQPLMVATMTEALNLRGGERVLEIGTGSGYAAAVLAEIAGKVFTIERHEALAAKAKAKLMEAAYDNVHVTCGDGTLGLPDEAPFDAIVVTAGGPEVPEHLRQQLKIGGRLVIPVGGTRTLQVLKRLTRQSEDEYMEEDLCDVRFVPLVGEEGWQSDGW